jgi:VWFA-related protein
MKRKKELVFFSLFVVRFAFLSAQDPAAPPIRTEVNYVRVDMYPLADDKPVTDLRPEEVELLEDGVPQRIEQFEHIQITGPRPQTQRREPSTMEEMRRAAKDPRARVFVLFLDPRHVDLEASMKVRQPLIDALNTLVGGDDLIAVMTPEMSPREITFTRRTNNIEQLLASYWGKKDWLGTRDRTEIDYEACYQADKSSGTPQDLAQRMITRRREMLVLDALEGLADHLRTLREERKAVITVSHGWPLFGPDRTLARSLTDKTGQPISVPVPPLGRDPVTGRPGTPNTGSVTISNDGMGHLDRQKCENDRLTLSEINHQERFIEIMQRANRANVSFYPIAAAGFSESFQTTMAGPGRALQMMADITDGQLVPVHNLEGGIQRVLDDLSSYYLLAYYSNVKADGKFHKISVRVKRPGVRVRARSGFFAAPAVETRSARPAAPDESPEQQGIRAALGTLSGFSRELPLRVRAAAGWTSAGAAVIRAVAEVPRGKASGDDWSAGGEAEATLINGAGKPVATARAAIDTVTYVADLTFAPLPQLPADDYRVQIRTKGASALGSTESVSFSLDAAPLGTGVMFLRRFGSREIPTADARFRRTERIVIEAPAGLGGAVAARLLNRTGSPISVPVTATIREAGDGTRWRRVEITLAPLASADYIVETTQGTDKALTAFRVIP